MPSYWRCKDCGERNRRSSSKRCTACGAETKPKKRLRGGKAILVGDTYPLFVQAAVEIHGVTTEACCVCYKPKPEGRRWDRDHDHTTGRPRGLACSGNMGCNRLMLPWVSPRVASAIATAKRYEGARDAGRWAEIAAYLARVDHFYASEAAAAMLARGVV